MNIQIFFAEIFIMESHRPNLNYLWRSFPDC